MSLQTRHWLLVFAAVHAMTFSTFIPAIVYAQNQNRPVTSGAELAFELDSLR